MSDDWGVRGVGVRMLVFPDVSMLLGALVLLIVMSVHERSPETQGVFVRRRLLLPPRIRRQSPSLRTFRTSGNSITTPLESETRTKLVALSPLPSIRHLRLCPRYPATRVRMPWCCCVVGSCATMRVADTLMFVCPFPCSSAHALHGCTREGSLGGHLKHTCRFLWCQSLHA